LGFYQVFLLFPLQKKRLREFEEIEISSKALAVTVNNKEEISEDFCLDFIQEFSLGFDENDWWWKLDI
jgi:hypothetical protein